MLLSNLNLLATAPGGVARLRELILTLAVQGKLVPQDPNDEPASVLLKKIRAEKDRLVAAGKIKRDKPLAEMAEMAEVEKPFGLPRGWEWVKGRDLFSVIRGVTYQKMDATDAPAETHLPILRANNIRDTVNLDDLIYVPATLVDAYQLLRSGDYVVCMASGSKHLVGKAAPYRETLVCSFGAFCGAIRPILEIAYFAVFLASPMYRDSVSEASAGIGINNLKSSSLLNLDIALPTEAEQSRIVTRVEELMRLCDALEAKGQLEATQHAQLVSTLLGTLTESETPEELADNWQRVATHFDLLLDRPEAVDALEQTILQLAVRGLLVPQDSQDEPASELLKKIRAEKGKLIADGKIKRDKPLAPVVADERPFEVPAGWEWARLGDVANIASNLVQPALHRAAWQVAPDCIEKGTGRLLERRTVAQAEVISANHLFKPGQILYSKIRPSLSKAVLVDFAGLCSADMYPIETSLDSQYLLMFILSQPFLDQVSIAENRVKMPKLNQEALVAFSVTVPPLVEQSRIVTRVAQLRSLCADLRQRLAASSERQSQLAQSLVGMQSTTTV